jgi:hypothetical protein
MHYDEALLSRHRQEPQNIGMIPMVVETSGVSGG